MPYLFYRNIIAYIQRTHTRLLKCAITFPIVRLIPLCGNLLVTLPYYTHNKWGNASECILHLLRFSSTNSKYFYFRLKFEYLSNKLLHYICLTYLVTTFIQIAMSWSIWRLGWYSEGRKKQTYYNYPYQTSISSLIFLLDYDSWQESQMWLYGWQVVVFYTPSSISWLCVALSSTRALSRGLLLWVAKHVDYFLLQAQCICKEGVFEDEWAVEIKTCSSCSVRVCSRGAMEDASMDRVYRVVWVMHIERVCRPAEREHLSSALA